MGNYLYQDKDGEFRWHDQPAPVRPATGSYWSVGWHSEGLSVTSAQAQQFQEDARRHGFVGVTFTDNGDCYCSSPKEKDRYLKYRGMHHRS